MEQFAGFDWPNIVSANGDQRDRPAAAVNELDLVAAAALVNMHDRSHVATIEAFVRRIAIQYDQGMFSNHLASLSNSIARRGRRRCNRELVERNRGDDDVAEKDRGGDFAFAGAGGSRKIGGRGRRTPGTPISRP